MVVWVGQCWAFASVLCSSLLQYNATASVGDVVAENLLLFKETWSNYVTEVEDFSFGEIFSSDQWSTLLKLSMLQPSDVWSSWALLWFKVGGASVGLGCGSWRPNPTWVSLPQRLGRPHLEQEPTSGNKTTVNHLAAQKDHTCEDHVLGVDHELWESVMCGEMLLLSRLELQPYLVQFLD